jgi:uroporphyrinogen decarboxylase
VKNHGGTESMTSKERVKRAFSNRTPDRVPINFSTNAGIEARLKAHFGLAGDDKEGLLRALRVDFRSCQPVYRGPKLHADIPERGIRCDDWGIRRRWVEHATGGYWDYCDFPLREATVDEVASWPMPAPDDYDYSGVENICRAHSAYAVFTGGAGFPDVINKNGMLRGMEQTLVDLITEDPAGSLLTQRRVAIQLQVLRRTLEAARGGIDLLWLGDDLGTQIAPIIGLDLYRKAIRPIHKRYVDLATEFGVPAMIHSCGSSSWAFEDFIEIGIRAVDTLQPEAANMAPRYLKDTFGGRLAFHGCISTAGPVARGTVDETVADCKQTLEIMMPGGGYAFAPTHQLQDNSPTENVVAMYEAALTYGSYS